MTYIVHRRSNVVTITIPANSYYCYIDSDYSAQDIPVLTFYEGDQVILQVSAESTPTVDGQTQIATSSLITQFVFT